MTVYVPNFILTNANQIKSSLKGKNEVSKTICFMLLIMFCVRYYFQVKVYKVLSSHYH